MNDDNKKQADRQSSDMAEKAALSEQELNDVAGGFTLFDTCQNRWAELICAEAPWGICPRLDMKKIRDNFGNFDNVIHYSVSCTKGCFKDVIYKERLDDF